VVELSAGDRSGSEIQSLARVPIGLDMHRTRTGKLAARRSGSVSRGGTNRPGDRRRVGVLAANDLIGDLATVDIDRARKLEREADPITLDLRDPDHAQWGSGVPDDNLFALSSGDHEHIWPPAGRLMGSR